MEKMSGEDLFDSDDSWNFNGGRVLLGRCTASSKNLILYVNQ